MQVTHKLTFSLESTKDPADWSVANTLDTITHHYSSPKKATYCNVKYRTFSLISHTSKVTLKVILKLQTRDNHTAEEQRAFAVEEAP